MWRTLPYSTWNFWWVQSFFYIIFRRFLHSVTIFFQSSQNLEWCKCRLDGCYRVQGREAVRESSDGNFKEVHRNSVRDSALPLSAPCQRYVKTTTACFYWPRARTTHIHVQPWWSKKHNHHGYAAVSKSWRPPWEAVPIAGHRDRWCQFVWNYWIPQETEWGCPIWSAVGGLMNQSMSTRMKWCAFLRRIITFRLLNEVEPEY